MLNLCTICQFDEAIVEYFILGMCQANTLDRMYTLEYGLGKQDGVARPFLKGRMNTNIKYNITSQRSAKAVKTQDETKNRIKLV